jgi:hypothetical protein
LSHSFSLYLSVSLPQQPFPPSSLVYVYIHSPHAIYIHFRCTHTPFVFLCLYIRLEFCWGFWRVLFAALSECALCPVALQANNISGLNEQN